MQRNQMTTLPTPPLPNDEPTQPAAIDALLRKVLLSSTDEFDTERHYARIAARLQQSHRPRSLWRAIFHPWWLAPGAFALGAACATVLVSLVIRIEPNAPALVEPLGSTISVNSTESLVQLRVRPEMTVRAFQTLLLEANAEVVSGPGALGVWHLRLPADQLQQSLEVLRRNKDVLEVTGLAP